MLTHASNQRNGAFGYQHLTISAYDTPQLDSGASDEATPCQHPFSQGKKTARARSSNLRVKQPCSLNLPVRAFDWNVCLSYYQK